MLERVLLPQQKQDKYIKQLASKVNLLTTHNKILQSQIAQQASSSTTPPGRLPNKPESNPREQCNAIVLRSGTQLEGPNGVKVDVKSQDEYDKGVAPLPNENEHQEKSEIEPSKESNSLSPRPYIPLLPFPQRFAKAQLDSQFDKFLDMLKKLHVNVPFIDILSPMPLYAKFLEEILPKKRKINEYEIIPLEEECTIVVLSRLLANLKDPSSFFIPCLIGNVSIDRALCDLGSSVS